MSLFMLCLLLLGTVSDAGASTVQQDPAASSLEPRNLQFSRISQREGLSQNSVNAIAQDRRGYIWIGTQEGLNRFDGNEMAVFEHDPFDAASLSSDWVWALLVDRGGDLWVGTDGGGLNRHDPEKNGFVRYQHEDGNPDSLGGNRVRTIIQDSKGNYWIGMDGSGVDRFDAET